MILDSVAELNMLHEKLQGFLSSSEESVRLLADTSGSAAPYHEFLAGLEVEKSDGPIYVSLTPDRWLRIEGGRDNLEVYVRFFAFGAGDDHQHHHPEQVFRSGYVKPGTLSVIIEADNEYVEELRRES